QSSYTEERRVEAFGGGYFRILDLDFQHRYAAGSRHDLVWGAGFRRTVDRLDKGRAPFDPDRRRDNLYGTFVQDDIALIPDELIVTLGSKFQHNAYSGVEIQPSARAIWKPNDHQGVWGAVSRAVRTPSRYLHDIRLDFRLPSGPIPMVGRLMGSDEVQSESVLAVEAGYRHRINQRVGIDVAVFHNDYDQLATVRRENPIFERTPEPRLLVPVVFDNGLTATTYGTEIATNWTLTGRWRLQANYSYLRAKYGELAPGHDHSPMTRGGVDPNHQIQLRSNLDLTEKLAFDTTVYYVSRLPGIGVPSYVRLDTRFGWRFTRNTELSVALQNLLGNRHPEFVSEDYVRNFEIGRAFYVKTTWEF
ncbi:MAG: TonB-dependent receptor, partial [bacterium]|nr:TonB-dependent receptor [bacterium]